MQDYDFAPPSHRRLIILLSVPRPDHWRSFFLLAMLVVVAAPGRTRAIRFDARQTAVPGRYGPAKS